ncbi:MAG: pilus assembly protein TadG-related protein [Methyloligellaceae bacterium]
MISVIPSILKFRDDDKGGVAIIFGICFVVLVAFMGLAIDGARVVYAARSTTMALDAAALAAAKVLSETDASDDEIKNIAKEYFEANVENTEDMDVDFEELQVVIDRSVPSVNLSIDGLVNNTFSRVMDFDAFSFSRNSTVIYDRKDIELGVMIDITGSMSGTKIADLKQAARDLVDILLPEDGNPPDQETRIGFAPYSATVNAGSYAAVVSDDESLDGCVFERNGADAYTDAAPDNGSFLSAEDDPADPENFKYSCPASEILPITDSRAQLNSSINSFSTGGWTAGHLGTAWAYYLISPEWSDVWPAESEPVEYNEADTIKAVILMTDGEFNTSYLNGAENQTSSDQAIEICDDMKSNNVVIYSVAFQAPANAEATLRACASDDGGYFNAENGEDLREAFRDIAIRLLNLRISG